MSKRINANEYRDVKISLKKGWERLPDGFLYSYKTRITPTKITPQDLPESYIPVWAGGYTRYINAANITSVVYKPNYVFNHVYKDDFLYISYNGPISVNLKADFRLKEERFTGEDNWIWGNDIVEFAKEIQKYSGLDMTEALKEMEEKRKWYDDADGDPKPNREKHNMVWGVNFINNTKEDN